MSTDFLLVDEIGERETVRIRLNKRENRNALDPAAWEILHEAILQAAESEARVVLLASAVKGVFCSGFEMGHTREIGPDSPLDTGLRTMKACCDLLGSIDKLTVSFADGAVMAGGVELFSSCDIRLATPWSRFQIPVVRLGSMYPLPGLERLLRSMDRATVAELLLVGRVLSAEEMLRAGLLTRTVPDEAGALDYCARASKSAPLAVSSNKRAIRAIVSAMSTGRIDDDGMAELEAIREQVFTSKDRDEALAAFREKRDPQFHGS